MRQRGITFPDEDTFTIDIQAKKEFTARSLSIRSIDIPIKADALFQARNEKGEFVTVKEFEIDRSNPSLNVGIHTLCTCCCFISSGYLP